MSTRNADSETDGDELSLSDDEIAQLQEIVDDRRETYTPKAYR